MRFRAPQRILLLAAPLGMTIAITVGLVYGRVRQPRSLRARLDHALSSSRLATAQVGARVSVLPEGRSIYLRNENALLVPASNVKLVTTAAALVMLGPGYEFHTRVGLRGPDLVVIGGGDPTFDRAFRGADPEAMLDRWAETLAARGVRVVRDIVVDASAFDSQYVHPAWPRAQLDHPYAAPVAGLSLNDNCVSVEVWPGPSSAGPISARLIPETSGLRLINRLVPTPVPAEHGWTAHRRAGRSEVVLTGRFYGEHGPSRATVTVPQPPRFFGDRLRRALAGRGIAVRGQVRLDRVLPGQDTWQPIDDVRTPLVPIIQACNRRSQNLYAEHLFKALGSTAAPATWRRGQDAVRRFLSQAGVPPAAAVVDDGSGLARSNRLSAQSITQLLAWMDRRPEGAIYRTSLAVPGRPGTLAHHAALAAPEYRGRIYAKTGTLDGVHSLSGYVQTRRGQWLAFSLLINGARGPVGDVLARFCRTLADHAGPAL